MKPEPNKPRKFTCYLTDRTMSAMRGDEPLSARLNQIVDRYLFSVSASVARIYGLFLEEDWRTLLDTHAKMPDHILDANDAHQWWARTAAEEQVDAIWCAAKLSPDDFAAMLELLETELMTGVAMALPGDT